MINLAFLEIKKLDGKTELQNNDDGDGSFARFAVNKSNPTFAAGRPDDETVYIYTRSSETLALVFVQEINVIDGFDSNSGFGKKIKFQKTDSLCLFLRYCK